MLRHHLLIALLILFLVSCSSEQEASSHKGMPPAAVRIVLPEAGNMSESLAVVGNLMASESALISAEIAATVQSVVVKDGQPVSKGDILFQLDASTLKAELKRAEADVKLRKEEKERIKALFAKKVTSQYDVDKADAQLDTANANLELAKAKLAKATIKAPFSGFVGIRKVNLGDYIKEGVALIELVKLDPLFVDFNMPETTLSILKQSDVVLVDIPALEQVKIAAQVVAIEPMVNAATRSIKVRASIDNEEHKFRPGLFARVHLPLKSASNVLWLPEAAIFLNGDDKLVLTNNEGKALRKVVTILSYQRGKVAISEGLDVADQVVVAGHHKVPFDGMPLMVTNPQAMPESAEAPE